MATTGLDVLTIFGVGVFIIVVLVILLANLNVPPPPPPTPEAPPLTTLTSISDIVSSGIYTKSFAACPNVIQEYATYLKSFGTVFTQSECPQGMSTISKAVGIWSFCYPSGTPIPAPPEQLKTDLNECGLKVTTQVPWVLVSVPTMTSVAPAQSTQSAVYQLPPNTSAPASTFT